MNAIDTDSPIDITSLLPGVDEQINSIQYDSDDSRSQIESYDAAQSLRLGVMQLDQDLNRFSKRPCAVCQVPGHSFVQCPKMNNTPEVKNIFGQVIAAIKRIWPMCNKLGISLEAGRNIPVQSLELAVNALNQSHTPIPPASVAHTSNTGISPLSANTGMSLPMLQMQIAQVTQMAHQMAQQQQQQLPPDPQNYFNQFALPTQSNDLSDNSSLGSKASIQDFQFPGNGQIQK